MADTSSYGYDLGIKDPRNAGSYVSIGEIVEGSLPEIKKDKYERKSLNGGSRAKNYSGSFFDGGTLTVKLVYEKAVYADLLAWVRDPDGYPCKITLADGSTITFNGLFESCGTPAPADGTRLESDVTIQCDGDQTFTPAA